MTERKIYLVLCKRIISDVNRATVFLREFNHQPITLSVKGHLVKRRLDIANAYLTPKVDCSNVTSPDAKNMVLSTSLVASVLFAKHIGPLIIKGMASVPPNIVR